VPSARKVGARRAYFLSAIRHNPSALARRDGKKRGWLLMDAPAAALRALELTFLIFSKGEDEFEWLLAILAIKFVVRHDIPSQAANYIVASLQFDSCDRNYQPA
jgi:hypothetical protein